MNRLLHSLGRLDDWAESLIFDRLLPRHRGGVALMLLGAILFGALWMTFDTPTVVKTPKEITSNPKEITSNLNWLKDRPWWDKYPNDRNATYHVYLFTKRGNGGVFLAAYVTLTAWRANYEFFVYKMVGSKLLYYFPESQTKGYTQLGIKEIKRGRFDLQMAVEADPKANNGKKTYFSWKKAQSMMEPIMKAKLEDILHGNQLPEEFR